MQSGIILKKPLILAFILSTLSNVGASTIDLLLPEYSANTGIERSMQAAAPGCTISSQVLCLITSGKDEGKRCSQVSDVLPGEPCIDFDVALDFKYCNLNDSPIKVLQKSDAEFKDESLPGVDTSNMGPGECREFSQVGKVNRCAGGFPAGLRIEGWIADKVSIPEFYCYAYDFAYNKWKLPSPTAEPTLIPTNVPSINPEPPALSLSIQCLAETFDGSGKYISCTSIIDDSTSCYRTIRYKYVIENDSPRPVKVQGLVVDRLGQMNNIVTDPLTLSTIPANEQIFFNGPFEELNLCELDGKKIETDAAVIAMTEAGKVPGHAEASYDFTVPKKPLDYEFSTIECFLGDGKHCYEYEGEKCELDVTFRYSMKSTAMVCHEVTTTTMMISSHVPEELWIDDKTCHERNFCPGETMIIPQKKTINICDYGTESIPFDSHINGVGPKTLSYNFNYAPPPPPPPTDACDGRPDVMAFKFKERLCSDSKNGQYAWNSLTGRKLSHSSSYETKVCEDFCELSDPSMITVASAYDDDATLFEDVVYEGQVFKFDGGLSGKIPSNLVVTIADSDGHIGQRFTLHASCSKPLALQDTFGSLKLVGLLNSNQNVGRFN